MIPITSVAGCELWYMLCSRTRSPCRIVATGSPVHVLIDMTLCTSRGSSVATDLQIDAPPRLSSGGLDGDAVPVQMPDGGHYVARDVDGGRGQCRHAASAREGC